MPNDKHLNFDLDFLNENNFTSKPKQNNVKPSDYRTAGGVSNGTKIASGIIIGVIVIFILYLASTSTNSKKTTYLSPSQSNTANVYSTSTGNYRCSPSYESILKNMEPSILDKISIDKDEKALDDTAKSIEVLRNRIKTTSVNKHSQTSIDNYNNMVNEHNSKLRSFNKTLKQYKTNLQQFNAGVDKYNAYLDKNCSKASR